MIQLKLDDCREAHATVNGMPLFRRKFQNYFVLVLIEKITRGSEFNLATVIRSNELIRADKLP